MLLGSAPVGAIPVGAAPGAVTVSVFLSGTASLLGNGQASPVLNTPLLGVAELSTGASASLKAPLNSLTGVASLVASASGRAVVRSFLIANALNATAFASANLGVVETLLPIFPVLPPLTWSVHKKPIMASRPTTAITGRENQLAAAAYPRWAFILAYGGQSWLRDQTQNIVPDPALLGFTEFEQLSALFLITLGPYGEFYYDDPDDDSRFKQAVGTGDGTTITFPLFVSWGFGPFNPSFTSPVGGINTIDAVYFNGTIQDPTTYSLDSTRTKLVFAVPPAMGTIITTDFHFYFRCRFLDDHLEFNQWARNRWECKEVRFESVKP